MRAFFVPKINLMNNIPSTNTEYHFLVIFATFTPPLSINGINTPIRHDPTNLTPFRSNMSEIRRYEYPFLGFYQFSRFQPIINRLLYNGLYIRCYIKVYKIILDFYNSSFINSNSL